MLIGAGVRIGGGPMRQLGAPLAAAVERNTWAQAGALRNFHAGEATVIGGVGVSASAGLTLGNLHPASWSLPRKAGGMAARGTIVGAGAMSGAGQSGSNMAANIIGSGDAGGTVGLILSLVASIVGSGGVSSAITQALATMSATLSGAGSVIGALSGLAAMLATLSGAGTVAANNTALMDIAATIRGYGEASAEGIRDAVWNALQSEINKPGTAGSALLAAGSAGDPWSTALPGSYTAGTAGALLAALYAGLTPAQQAQLLDIWQRLGLDPANPQVTTATTIEAGGVSQTIAETAGPTITVTRVP